LDAALEPLPAVVDPVPALVVEWGKPLAGGQGEAAGWVMAAEAVATETGSIEFGILGPLEVSRAGRSVSLGGPRQRAVLALLLLEADRVVSMDRLAEEVWAGHPPDGWATTLQTYVFHLRRALEPERPRGGAAAVLVTRDRGYLLRVDRAHVDSVVFEEGFTAGRAALDAGRYAEAAQTLRRVLGLWRGPVLANLADYAFTRPEAARLQELRLAALEVRIEADLALGRHDTLTAELDGLVREHSLRERLHGQLMLALYRSGRQADALAAYRRARDLLAGELGIDPGEPLECLHAAVLAHDPALDWVGTAAPADGRPGAASAATQLESPRRMAEIGGALAGPRRRGRRLLVAGSALVVAAAACVLAVTRPWAAEPTGLPANSVGVISESGRRIGAPVMVGSPAGLAYGDGSVWAVNSAERTVSRINPASHAVVQTIPVGPQPTALTVTGTDVWVTNSGDATVTRINTAANAVVDTIRVGNGPVAIDSGPSGVWVANQGDHTVDRIDPTSGIVTVPSIEVGELPDGIAVGEHAVWVANSQDGTVSRIDPVSGTVSGPASVGAGPAGIAVTPAAVWVANSLGLTVSRLDPATGQVTATIGVGDGPRAITAAGDGVWVADQFDATLHRIDPQTDRVDRVVSLGSSPQGIVVAPSGLWVAARPFAAAAHRGGTLIEVTSPLPQLDPVHDISAATPALAGVYDGLLGFGKAGGAQGQTLVPDLAVELPRPTDGGRTYTFTLRRGIRYSNGAVVQASDFRRGIQREISFGDAPEYYETIVGAPACRRNPRQCDLTAGIVVDDAAGTVVFHLDRADPSLPYKLALLWAAPAPLGAADHLMDSAPFLPGTGPYMVSQYQPNSSLTLVRNPNFRQWSYAAQPAGYPDEIRIDQIADPHAQQFAVSAGRADVVDVTDERYGPLALRYPTRVHSGLKLGTISLFLNTRQPPFNNLEARKAVNFAIDRGRLIQLFHLVSPDQATVTCQILPAGFPSHRPYCPYTADAGDGGWHGPDMAKAALLARQSGTTHVPVTIWTVKGGIADDKVNAYLRGVFEKLGYRTTVRTLAEDQLFATAGNSSRKIQAGLAGWIADIPTASDFFLPALSCSSFDQDPTHTANYAEFCDPHADQLARNAQAAQQTDPAAARKLWAQVDRLVTEQAPWVPLLNLGGSVFVSARAGNYQDSPYYGGPLLDQMWVQ
jgi:YVTN family beta-propeller protein